MKYIAMENAPETKVTPSGFLAANLIHGVQGTPVGDPFDLADASGHIKDLRLKFYTRTTPAQMSTTDNCDIDLVPAYDEVTIDTVSTVKFGLHFNDVTIARYCKEASDTVAFGNAPTDFMREHLAGVLASMNGFIGKIDQTLLNTVTWGINVVSTNNSATSVNFNDNLEVNLVTEGWTKIMQDYAMNEGFGRPVIVGSGIINALAMQGAQMTQYAQFNNNAARGAFDYYHDIHSSTIWGSNQFGVFMPGNFGLVQLDKYVGFRAGAKGTSVFWNMPIGINLPGAGDGIATNMGVDFQMKYIDCPTEATVGYSETTLDRGWSLIMSKNIALWQLPDDAFQASDRLTGVNGALRYTATNS